MIGYHVTRYGNTNCEALGVSGKPVSFRKAAFEGNNGELIEYLLMQLS